MGDIVYSFLKSFISPNQVEKSFRVQRTGVVPLEDNFLDVRSLDLVEAVCLSWLFKIMEGGFILLSLYLAEVSTRFVETNYSKIFVFFDPNYLSQKIILATTILMVIFFPLISYSYIVISKAIIKFCMDLFKIEDQPEAVNQVISHSFSSNILLCVPIFGSIFRNIAGHLFIYSGLRNNIGMSSKQASVTMLAPVILMLTLSAFFFVFFYLFFTTFLFPSLGV